MRTTCRVRTSRLVASLALVALARPDAGAHAVQLAPTDPVQLVALVQPQPPMGLATSTGTISLSYRVLEMFAGETGGASIVVRHAALEREDRERLAAGERVILVASPDPDAPGRWLAPAPLRATDGAVDAFRRWSAPDDVRRSRPLADVVAEARGARVVAEDDVPAQSPAPVVRVESGAEPLEEESIEATAAWAEPEPVAADDEEISPVVERPPEPNVTQPAESARPRGDSRADDGRLVPADGPGLPPDPTERVLGPELNRRASARR